MIFTNCNMWIILLSLFLFSKDVVGEVSCDNYFLQQCQRPELFKQIPRNVRRFKALCPQLSQFVECWRDYDMKCEEENYRIFDQPEKYADFIAVLDEICEEGSTLNEVVTSNLKCFNKTLSNTNCLQEKNDFLKPYEEDIPLDVFTFTTDIFFADRVYCLGYMFLTNCILTDIKRNCGIRARHAAVEFVHRTGFVDAACPLNSRKSLLPDIDEFELTEEQKTFAIAELERMKISDDWIIRFRNLNL